MIATVAIVSINDIVVLVGFVCSTLLVLLLLLVLLSVLLFSLLC